VAYATQGGRLPGLATITGVVAERFGVPGSTLTLRGRHHNEAREVALYLARQCSGCPLSALEAHLGGIAPSGVTIACKRVARRMESDRELCRRAGELHDELNDELDEISLSSEF